MTGRRKLLLADDSPTIQKVISLTFADEGMEVVTASDGREALRRLEDGPAPDILLADVVMPGPDGYELCARVKGDGRLSHVPVVLLVGIFEPFNEAEARRVGADAVLTKPFQSIRDLVSKVGSLLGSDPKQETEESRPPAREEEEGHRELAAEVQTRADDVPASGPAAAPAPAPAPALAPEAPETSFADLEADDELIEATPAEAFGNPPPAHAAGAQSFSELDDEPLAGEPVYEPRPPASASPVPAAAESGALASFDARPAATATADDALLDLGLGDAAPAAAGGTADDGEFILDLDDDFPALDVPSAHAEAAHGGQPAAAETEAARTPFEFSSVPSEVETRDPALVREVVSQEAPPAAALSREFIEPQVVPADEGAAPRGEFTDGSVEGDTPKPPPFIPEAPPAPSPFVPETPSAAGFAVGEARAGVEEREERAPAPTPAAELSPETIDAIARRVVELMSDRVVREIAWEVVPDLAELIIKRRLDEEGNR